MQGSYAANYWEAISRDIKRGFRLLFRFPSYSVPVLLLLALGISVSTVAFSVISAVFFRPLPFPESNRLVSVSAKIAEGGSRIAVVSYPTFFDWRKDNQVFSHLVAYHDDAFTLAAEGQSYHLNGEVVSWEMFPLLGVQPLLGRGFLPGEESSGSHVIVISYQLWVREFGADPNVINSLVTVNGQSFAIIGVAPKLFQFPLDATAVDLWTTSAVDAVPIKNTTDPPLTAQRGAGILNVIGRLKPGTTMEAANAQMNLQVASLAKKYTEGRTGQVFLQPEIEAIIGGTRDPLLLLTAAVGLVFLIACANITSLNLVQTAQRGREMAMRVALGASPKRLVLQFVVENLVLTACGAAAGLVLCAILTPMIIHLAAFAVPRIQQTVIDWHVVLFLLAISSFATLLVSVIPCLELTRPNFAGSLRSGLTLTSISREKAQRALIVCQVTLGLVLLSTAGLLMWSFLRLEKSDIGIRTANLATFKIVLPDSQYAPPLKAAFYQDLIGKLEASPGVDSAAAGGPLPLEGDALSMAFERPGRLGDASNRPRSDMAFITPGFFKTMGIPIVRGRDFSLQDRANSLPVYIVNEAFANKFFPGQDPIGQRIHGGPAMFQIVGVVANARQSYANPDPQPVGYLDFFQMPLAPVSVVVHSRLPGNTVEPAFRNIVASMDSHVPIYDVRTIEEVLSSQLAQPRLSSGLLAGFAVIALLLTSIGIYGTMAYFVSSHVRDLAVRLALGAEPRRLTNMVLWRATILMLFGVVCGVIGSEVGAHALRGLLYGIGPYNPLPVIAACLIVLLAGAIAAYVPAHRAASIDPMKTLRSE
jgi:putative ABC transport system permease protein